MKDRGRPRSLAVVGAPRDGGRPWSPATRGFVEALPKKTEGAVISVIRTVLPNRRRGEAHAVAASGIWQSRTAVMGCPGFVPSIGVFR